MSVRYWDGLKVWWWAFSRTLNNSDKESFVNTLLVISTLARWPELSKQERATLKGVIFIILEWKYVKEREKIQAQQFKFWTIPIYPSIPLDGVKVDPFTRTSTNGCTFSIEIQTSAPKTNWGIRSNQASGYAEHHTNWFYGSLLICLPLSWQNRDLCDMEHSISCSKITIIMLQYFTRCHTKKCIRTQIRLFDHPSPPLKLHAHHHLQQIEEKLCFYYLT